MTRPNSANTATQVTSDSCPVRVALGVGCSKPVQITGNQLKKLQFLCMTKN